MLDTETFLRDAKSQSITLVKFLSDYESAMTQTDGGGDDGGGGGGGGYGGGVGGGGGGGGGGGCNNTCNNTQ